MSDRRFDTDDGLSADSLRSAASSTSRMSGKRVDRPTVWLAAMIMLSLACGGLGAADTAANVRVLDLPRYICPSSTPRPTHTPRPTQMQSDIHVPPSDWRTTYREDCTTVWNGYAYVEQCTWVEDGGYWANPGYTVPGPTSTPRPTHTPYPTPTPYTRDTDYPLGHAVYTEGTLTLRLWMGDLQVRPHPDDPAQQIVSWRVRVRNLGDTVYNTWPAAQTFVGTVEGRSGYWGASAEALRAAGLAAVGDDILALSRGAERTQTLAAFTPRGEVTALGWALDPYSGGLGEGVQGGNVAYWRVDAPPPADCQGDLDTDPDIPTRVGSTPTPTATATPDIPAYTGEGR